MATSALRENAMYNAIDFICQYTMEGKIIPLRIRLRDEDGELQEYTIKGYRDTSEFSNTSFECKIIVRDCVKIVNIFSADGKVWRIK